MITITDAAVLHLKKLLDQKNLSFEESGLRLLVEKGGCAGMQYVMKIGSKESGDEVVESGGVRVFVDQESLRFLNESQLDYVDSLNDSGFKIENPKAARSCGCGTSFEPIESGAPAGLGGEEG